MWKIPVFLFIIAVMGICGIILSTDLHSRRRELAQFRFALSVMEGEMNCETSSLSLCFQRAARYTKGNVALLLADAASLLEKNGSGEDSLMVSLELHRENLAFTENDLEHIRCFAKGLGEKDLEHTVKDLHQLEERLRYAEMEAEANDKKWGRLFRSGGWLVGLCAALIFL